MKKKIILLTIFLLCILLLTQILKVRKSYFATMSILGYKNNDLYTTGTGFVYKLSNSDAYIITNYHVIENSDTLYVQNVQDKTCKATIFGYDDYFDIAILKTDKKCMLSKIDISKSSKKNKALIIVSNKSENYKKKILFSKIINSEKFISPENSLKSLKVIELNSEFNYGNSGSPVIDINGNLQGVLTLKSLENGNGYAIDASDVHYIVNLIEKNQIIKRKSLGLVVASAINKEVLNSYGINNLDSEIGVVVLDARDVNYNIKKGDIITKINGYKINSSSEYQYYMSKFILEKEIIIEYYRDEKLHKVSIKI